MSPNAGTPRLRATEPGTPAVHPGARFAVSLLASLALWLPSALACLRGDIDLAAAGLRYLAALALATAVVRILAHLVTSYDDGDQGPPPPQRRREDQPAPVAD